jgi:hypothetical protein
LSTLQAHVVNTIIIENISLILLFPRRFIFPKLRHDSKGLCAPAALYYRTLWVAKLVFPFDFKAIPNDVALEASAISIGAKSSGT